MKKLLCLIILTLSSVTYAKTTFKQAQEVFKELNKLTGQHLILKYSSDLNSNAWASITGITINRGMLNDCRNKSDLAMVLGHEMGHWLMKDPWSIRAYMYMEIRADRIGYGLCQQLKYGSNQCKSFFIMMYYKYGNESDEVHPTWLNRLQMID